MVCATKKHTGKTSVSMALFHRLQEHFQRLGGSVGYMKPIGQEWVQVMDGTTPVRADKDAALAYNYFGLTDSISDVSPVVIGRGDTKAFLDGARPDLSDLALTARLRESYDRVAAAHDFVVVEGTGHCGVGSILGWNNARVAATLGIDVVLVANGGIGSTFDELALNASVCRAESAALAGIIINKCAPKKVAEVEKYLTLASERAGWAAPVLGVVPFGNDLDQPSVHDLEHTFGGGFSNERYNPGSRRLTRSKTSMGQRAAEKTAAVYAAAVSYAAGAGTAAEVRKKSAEAYAMAVAVAADVESEHGIGAESEQSHPTVGGDRAEPVLLLAGAEYRHRRFLRYELAAASLERFMCSPALAVEAADPESVCFITHITRSDIIQGLMMHQAMAVARGAPGIGGLILAGAEQERPQLFLNEHLRSASFPILRSNLPLTETMAAIKDLRPKMQADDKSRVSRIIQLYAPYLGEAVERLTSRP